MKTALAQAIREEYYRNTIRATRKAYRDLVAIREEVESAKLRSVLSDLYQDLWDAHQRGEFTLEFVLEVIPGRYLGLTA